VVLKGNKVSQVPQPPASSQQITPPWLPLPNPISGQNPQNGLGRKFQSIVQTAPPEVTACLRQAFGADFDKLNLSGVLPGDPGASFQKIQTCYDNFQRNFRNGPGNGNQATTTAVETGRPAYPAHSTSPLTATETSGWQTYRNEKLGFSFRYPEKTVSIGCSKGEGEEGTPLSQCMVVGLTFPPLPTVEDNPPLASYGADTDQVVENKNNLSLDEFIKTLKDGRHWIKEDIHGKTIYYAADGFVAGGGGGIIIQSTYWTIYDAITQLASGKFMAFSYPLVDTHVKCSGTVCPHPGTPSESSYNEALRMFEKIFSTLR